MFRVYLASIRLAIALVCVGLGVIIGGVWVGVIPDQSPPENRHYRQKCERIALTSALLVRDGRWDELGGIMQAIVDQDAELVAVAIDTPQHRLFVADSQPHRPDSSTVEPDARRAASENEPGGLDHPPSTSLALIRDGVVYGKAEFYHRFPLAYGWHAFARHPLLRLFAFFVIAGVGMYTLFVIRMMHGFEVTQVVPDRVRDAIDALSEGLLVMDERERILLANRAFSKTVGLSQESLLGRRAGSLPWICSEFSSAEDLPWVRAIASGQPQTEQLMRYRLPNGRTRFFSIYASPVQSSASRLGGALVTFRDVTQFEEHRAELEQMLAMLRHSRDEISCKNRELEILATQDALTGCLNRRALFEGLDRQWRDASQDGGAITCVMVDVDHFKAINDRYGHQVGDTVLQKVGQLLRAAFPSPSLVCRYGGEEFCLILPGLDMAAAVAQAEAARREIESIRLTGVPGLRMTVSIGLSDLGQGASEPHQLIHQADRSLYAAKEHGRNRIVPYNSLLASTFGSPPAVDIGPDAQPADETQLPFQAVAALVSALAYRDVETAEHSRRVAELCVRLASGVLDQRETYILEIAALLHDIGKIGVPDQVLLKPGPLNEEDWKLMRRNDQVGLDIASSTLHCAELDKIIRAHRAFYGGQAGDAPLPTEEEIPIAARLLMIADSYDAMVHDRVYREGRSHTEAVAELRRCAGTQFDPRLVEHFAATVTERQSVTNLAADAVTGQTAMQFGLQIEQLADALDTRDVDSLQSVAARLAALARYLRIESIAVAAERIEAGAAEENMQWINLLRDTQLLMNLCRTAQRSCLDASGKLA
jgi:diguanylate cyclase (GGDEF)-like protein/PAS domain S-box-containing protein